MQAMPSSCQTSVFQIKDFTGLWFMQAVFSKFQAAKKFIKIAWSPNKSKNTVIILKY